MAGSAAEGGCGRLCLLSSRYLQPIIRFCLPSFPSTFSKLPFLGVRSGNSPRLYSATLLPVPTLQPGRPTFRCVPRPFRPPRNLRHATAEATWCPRRSEGLTLKRRRSPRPACRQLPRRSSRAHQSTSPRMSGVPNSIFATRIPQHQEAASATISPR